MKVRYLRPVLFLAWQEQDGGYPKASGLLLSWFGRASRGGLLLAVGEKAKGLKVVILRVLINLTNSILLCGEKRGSESLDTRPGCKDEMPGFLFQCRLKHLPEPLPPAEPNRCWNREF